MKLFVCGTTRLFIVIAATKVVKLHIKNLGLARNLNFFLGIHDFFLKFKIIKGEKKSCRCSKYGFYDSAYIFSILLCLTKFVSICIAIKFLRKSCNLSLTTNMRALTKQNHRTKSVTSLFVFVREQFLSLNSLRI